MKQTREDYKHNRQFLWIAGFGVMELFIDTGKHFFLKIGKFGVPYFHDFVTDSYHISCIY